LFLNLILLRARADERKLPLESQEEHPRRIAATIAATIVSNL
jgi:hypothetical protein